MRRARLYADDALRVLWLSQGRQELALSDAGVWLRSGRRQRDLPWAEIEQVQVRKLAFPGGSLAWVDLFTATEDHRVGLFPAGVATSWVEACATAAAAAGHVPLPLDGASGFALTVEARAS
ncbi:MAG: hypothetical protein M3O86_01680 [Actinomycetota bacterium]|nr:hypothetical protein [Actinomycetota bacterium]